MFMMLGSAQTRLMCTETVGEVVVAGTLYFPHKCYRQGSFGYLQPQTSTLEAYVYAREPRSYVVMLYILSQDDGEQAQHLTIVFRPVMTGTSIAIDLVVDSFALRLVDSAC